MSVRQLRSALLVSILALLAASTLHAGVVISQVYGGAGCGSAGCSTYKNDYVELFNPGTTAVVLTGYSVQYGSSGGTGGWNVHSLPAGLTIQPGGYLLIGETGNANGVNPLPTPDASGGLALSASAGKVALVSSTTALSGACPTANVVDEVGYGSANCFEGSGSAPALSTTTAAFRANGGATDTNDNKADFSAAAPNPRNSGPSDTNNPPAINAPANPAASVVVGTPTVNVTLTGSDDRNVYNWSVGSASNATVAISGSSTSASVTVVVTLSPGFIGTASFMATLSDNVNPAVSRTVNVEVTPVPGSTPGTVVISQFYGGGGNVGSTLANDFIELFNRSNSPVDLTGWSVQHFFTFPAPTWTATPLSGVIQPHGYYLVQEAAGNSTGGGTVPLPTPDAVGSITVSATNGVIALSTSSGLLSGDGCATRADVVDSAIYGSIGTTCTGRVILGPALSNTNGATRRLGGCMYTPAATDFTVWPPAPRNSATPASDCTGSETFTPHVMISQIYGGGGNSNASYANDFVELYNPTDADAPIDGWSIQYASATGSGWSNSQVLGGTVPSHGYFLIELASGGTAAPALPSPRIIGGINMSGTQGKVALVRSYTPLSGDCPIGDPSLVDFIGYGGATCFEGGLAAPSLNGNNAKALVRATNTDTNQNSIDFSLAAPNPRGSGTLVELPPLVSSTDPQGADAPYDASITVNFTEPVNVAPGWFSVSCTTTGVHTDFAVASAFEGSTFILTPAVTFAPRETCTVHIFKNLVTDQDTIDGPDGINDNLPADVEWTFTVAVGTPVENAAVHLTMGNPSNAIDSTATPNNYLMEKPEYAESYNASKGTPNWVSWHLTSEWIGTGGRTDTFRPDPALPPTWYRILQTDFSGSGFDRGHMCPSADRTATIPINQATFLMSNMVPQGPNNNQGPWENFETYLRSLTPCNTPSDPCKELYIVSGPEGSLGTITDNPHITIPKATWKVALVLPKQEGNDVARVDASTTTLAIRIPNDLASDKKSTPWTDYETSVRDIESTTGYDFFSNVPRIVQNSIETSSSGDGTKNPPGVADQSASTAEDHPITITLKAVSPDPAATFTYSILTPPSHGSLSGSGASQTYTPAPDFNGNDSFTFRVNDGHQDSNVGSMNVTISEVNDAPVTTDDTATVEAGGILKLAPATLIANDVAGPANESSQTLTMTAVASTATTHGTVALANGEITFTPEPFYVGPATFTYTVCDDGTTAGQAASLCSSGTVKVEVKDTTPPSISELTPSVKQLWPANHQMVDVAIDYSTTDLGDPSPICTLTVLSSEPVNGTGDGDMTPDWVIVDAHRVSLRAERAGSGNGRIYTISATCTDRSGNVAQSGGATVVVPKSQSK